MTLDPQKSPAVFSVLWSWLVLFVAAFLPLWTISPASSWPGAGPRRSTLWDLFAHLPVETRDWNPAKLWAGHRENLAELVVVLVVGGGLGRLVYWWRWERRRAGKGGR
jgi:hypothetical protein